jgi:hypothetical protein
MLTFNVPDLHMNVFYTAVAIATDSIITMFLEFKRDSVHLAILLSSRLIIDTGDDTPKPNECASHPRM